MNVLAVVARVEDPNLSKNKWLPGNAELIYGTLAFAVVAFLLVKFAGPAIAKGMAARTDRIAKELVQASNATQQSENQAATIRADKGDIEAERARLLGDADATAARMLVEGRERIAAEVVQLDAKADAEIGAAGGRVNAELSAEIARHAAGAAERAVIASLDHSTQVELIEKFIQEVGAS